MKSLKSDWLPAVDLRQHLVDLGIGEADLLRLVAWAMLHIGVIASGFQRIHRNDDVASAEHRKLIDSRIWRVFDRVDPAWDRIDGEVKDRFQRIVRWSAGEFTWTMQSPDGDWLQETWESVHFDRLSVESMLHRLERRQNAQLLHDFEIDEWIKSECVTDNSKEAWQSFKLQFGKRVGKRSPTFTDAWNRVKGNRGRGRPRLKANKSP